MLAFSSLFQPQHVARPAWGLPAPTGWIMLTVTGAIAWPNRGSDCVFDLTLLREFPQHSAELADGASAIRSFRGTMAKDLLRAAGRLGDDLTLHATDGRRVLTSYAELRSARAMVATECDGLPLACTRHGPLALVLPHVQSELLPPWRRDALTIWGLTRIDVARRESVIPSNHL